MESLVLISVVCHQAFERLELAIIWVFIDEYRVWYGQKSHDSSCVSQSLSVGRGWHYIRAWGGMTSWTVATLSSPLTPGQEVSPARSLQLNLLHSIWTVPCLNGADPPCPSLHVARSVFLCLKCFHEEFQRMNGHSEEETCESRQSWCREKVRGQGRWL